MQWWWPRATALRPPPNTPFAVCGNQDTKSIETSEEGLVGEKEFPWIVSLQDSHYTHLTFGSILSQFWILSIASAFQNRPVPLPLGPARPPGVGWGCTTSCLAWGGLEGGFLVTGTQGFLPVQPLLCVILGGPKVTRCQSRSSLMSSAAK